MYAVWDYSSEKGVTVHHINVRLRLNRAMWRGMGGLGCCHSIEKLLLDELYLTWYCDAISSNHNGKNMRSLICHQCSVALKMNHVL